MMEMSFRVRNRLQDGLVNWQENRYQKSELRQQHADIHRARMTCSASLPTFQQTQDWTGGMAVSSSGRFRVVEDKKRKQPLISSEGIQWNVALAVLAVLGLVFAGILLADLAGMGTESRTLSKLSEKIETIENRNKKLQEELIQNTSNASVCTEAVKLDLISSNGAKTIRLTAPGNATLTFSSAAKAAENADLEGRLTSYAGD